MENMNQNDSVVSEGQNRGKKVMTVAKILVPFSFISFFFLL